MIWLCLRGAGNPVALRSVSSHTFERRCVLSRLQKLLQHHLDTKYTEILCHNLRIFARTVLIKYCSYKNSYLFLLKGCFERSAPPPPSFFFSYQDTFGLVCIIMISLNCKIKVITAPIAEVSRERSNVNSSKDIRSKSESLFVLRFV